MLEGRKTKVFRIFKHFINSKLKENKHINDIHVSKKVLAFRLGYPNERIIDIDQVVLKYHQRYQACNLVSQTRILKLFNFRTLYFLNFF